MSWISKDSYLTQSEMENNANIIINTYRELGYADISISALLGNFQAESTINPGLWERGGGGGFGIIQWTPQSALINECEQLGLSPYTDGYIQTEVIWKELYPSYGLGVYFITSSTITHYATSGATSNLIGLTGDELLKNTKDLSLDELTTAYMIGRERPSYNPSINHISTRKVYSANWYEYITGEIPPTPPTPPSPTPTIKRKLPIYMMIRNRR